MTVLFLQVLCSTCGYKGVIKKTKETPGFVCLCQGGFYGDRCQHEGKFTYLFIIILLIFLLLLQPSLYYHYYPHYYLTNRLHFSVYVYCNRSHTTWQMSSWYMYLNFTVLLPHYFYHYLRNRKFIACDYQVKMPRGMRVKCEAIAEGFTRIFRAIITR